MPIRRWDSTKAAWVRAALVRVGVPNAATDDDASLARRLAENGFECYWPKDGVRSAAYRARFPDASRQVAMAQELVNGRIQFWHPWHMERTAETARLGAPVAWDPRANGDVEWTHALARLSHLTDLAAAFASSGQEPFLKTFVAHVHGFAAIRDRPRARWENWLDASLRVVNLLRAYDLVRAAPTLPAEIHRLVPALIARDAEFVAARFTTRRTNWSFFGSAALLCAATVGHTWGVAEAWRVAALERLEWLQREALLPDGGLVEQAPMYDGVTALALLDAVMPLYTGGAPIPDIVVAIVRQLLRSLVELVGPDGRIPPIGDSDAFPLEELTAVASVVLGDAEPAAPDYAEPTATVAGGWHVVRWRTRDGKAAQLWFDATGRPPADVMGHSHADDLQLLLHGADGPLLVDPGRFTYAHLFTRLPWELPWRVQASRFARRLLAVIEPRFRALNGRNWREHFRATRSHSTVMRDATDQPGYGWPPADAASVSGETPRVVDDVVLLEASARTPDGAQHRRTVLVVAPTLLVTVDSLDAPVPAQWSATFRLAPGVAAAPLDDGVRLRTSSGSTHALTALELGVGRPAVQIAADWVSPEYGVREPASVLRLPLASRARATLVTAWALDPEVALAASPGTSGLTIRAVESAGGTGVAVDGGGLTAYIRLAGDALADGPWWTDAPALVHQPGASEATVRVIGGSAVRWDGTALQGARVGDGWTARLPGAAGATAG